jgi:hypothetical protein
MVDTLSAQPALGPCSFLQLAFVFGFGRDDGHEP